MNFQGVVMQDRSFKILLLVSIITSCFTASADGIFKWKDARGNTQYGDQPPKKSRARAVDMPPLTVIEDYGKQWEPLHFKTEAPLKNTGKRQATILKTKSVPSFIPSYQSLNFIAPKANQIIYAKDGDVSAMLSLKPPLKRGHSIVFYIDGKRMNSGSSRITNFKTLSAGSHSVFASIIDQKGKLAMKSDVISFNVKK